MDFLLQLPRVNCGFSRARLSVVAVVFLSACFATQPVDVLGQQDVDSIAQLREIEAKVEKVVEANMNACVSISDGYGAGSGVVVTEKGLVLTAGHVMVGSKEPHKEYQILFPDGRTAKAKPLGKNLDIDAGMIQITDPGPWPHVKIGKTKSLSEGDWVVLLGHSGGFELGRKPPVRTGRVLGMTDKNQLETDAVLIGGDSGGPLFDLDGKLVGIHSSIGDSIAENRHVTTEDFARDYDRMNGGEQWGTLPSLADTNDGTKPPKMGIVVDRATGLVKEVKNHSPASDAGVKVGDIAREFDGILLDDGSHLIKLVKEKITGDVVLMKFDRNGRLLDFEIRLR